MSIDTVYFLQGLRCSVGLLRTESVFFRTAAVGGGCGRTAAFARRLRITPADVAPYTNQLALPLPSPADSPKPT